MTPPVIPTVTPLMELDLTDPRRAFNQLDVMGRLIASFGPDGANMDPSTGTFAYRGGLFRDGLGGLQYEPAGTIVCPNNAVSFVQVDAVNGVTQSATLDPAKFAIAEVSRGTAAPSGSTFHVEDIRDLNLHDRVRFLDDLEDVSLYDLQDEDILKYSTALGLWVNVPDTGGGGPDWQDEGTPVLMAPATINVVGAGASLTNVGGIATLTVPGAGSSSLSVLRHHRKRVVAMAASNTPSFLGIGDPANLGTATAGPLSNTNFNTTQVRIRQTASSVGTNENAGRSVNSTSTTILVLGDAAGLGGFSLIQRFAFATVLGVRGFFGVATANGVAGTNPSAKLNILGLGFDTGDTTFFLMHNDGSGTATRTNTSVTFALNVVYEVEIECGANSTGITVALYSVDATGRTLLYGPQAVTTDLPAGNVLLSPTTTISNGAAGGTQPVLDFHYWLLDTR